MKLFMKKIGFTTLPKACFWAYFANYLCNLTCFPVYTVRALLSIFHCIE